MHRQDHVTFDLSQIDLDKLREEFARKVQRKATVLQDIRDIVEQKLAEMLDQNPLRMDYQVKYEQIVTEYNHAKDRTTIENTFRELVELANSLDEEQKRATREGLSEEELALFDIRELSASEDEISNARLIASACISCTGGQADAHPISELRFDVIRA